MNILSAGLTNGIKVYQRLISPLFPARCKYAPSCSNYCLQALHRHGLCKGMILSICRLLRCNPFSDGGVNYIPLRGSWTAEPYVVPSESDSWVEAEDNNMVDISGNVFVFSESRSQKCTADAVYRLNFEQSNDHLYKFSNVCRKNRVSSGIGTELSEEK